MRASLTLRNSLSSRSKRTASRKAAAAVELSIVLPFLLFLFVASVDFARIYSDTQLVTECARAGAIYAADPDLADRTGHETAEALILIAGAKLYPKPQISVVYGTDERNHKYVQVTVQQSFKLMTSVMGSSPLSITRTCRARLRPAALE